MTLRFAATCQLGAFRYEAAFEAMNEIVVLFGHSGAGKSLTLQMVAGLLRPASGFIEIDGRTVFDGEAGTNVAPQGRGVGYVVQELALFPHMSVRENVAFGMAAGAGRNKRTGELLDLLEIADFADRKPATLSGGQRQRVALARALGRGANLLLLDEPFSALDESLRGTLRRELLRLRAELGLTVVFVTHDLREAHLLADRLAVFDAGRLLQFGPREEVFRRPVTRRVAELTGVANLFQGVVRESGEGGVVLEALGTRLRAPHPRGSPLAVNETVDVGIRAERINLRRGEAGALPNSIAASISQEFAFGSTHTLRLRFPGGLLELDVELASRPYEVLGVAHRKDWTLELPASDLHVMRR